MPVEAARDTLVLTLRQRCFWLFGALLLLIVAVPFFEGTPHGRIALNVTSLLVLLASSAVVGRSAAALVIALLLAVPAAGLQVIGYGADQPALLVLSQAFAAAFYFMTVSYLLTHVLRREVLTMDKLYGAAAAFLMMGILWAYFYNILLVFHPGALSMSGAPITAAPPSTILYFSLATLTATGLSDILPVHPVARMLCALEMITGVLFIAVLIARLAGGYPQQR